MRALLHTQVRVGVAESPHRPILADVNAHRHSPCGRDISAIVILHSRKGEHDPECRIGATVNTQPSLVLPVAFYAPCDPSAAAHTTPIVIRISPSQVGATGNTQVILPKRRHGGILTRKHAFPIFLEVCEGVLDALLDAEMVLVNVISVLGVAVLIDKRTCPHTPLGVILLEGVVVAGELAELSLVVAEKLGVCAVSFAECGVGIAVGVEGAAECWQALPSLFVSVQCMA